MVGNREAVILIARGLALVLLWVGVVDAPGNPGVRTYTGMPMERPLDNPSQLHSFCSRGHHITVLGDNVVVVRGGCK